MSDYTVIDNSFTDGIQPDSVKLTMKSHQLKVFKKCLELENNDIKYRNQTEEDNEEHDEYKKEIKYDFPNHTNNNKVKIIIIV